MIHTTRASKARLVAVEGIKGGRPGLAVAPPLYLYRANGSYTTALLGMLSR
jgi:tRNA1(Val) A37 N6-methylase TrmN6